MRRVWTAFFVFISLLALASCTKDEDEEATLWSSLLTAHDWEVRAAQQRMGQWLIDVKEADLYCRFTADSVFFSEGGMVVHFEANGGTTHTTYEITPCGSYAYAAAGNKIYINNEIFTPSINADTLALQSEGWRLVLVKK